MDVKSYMKHFIYDMTSHFVINVIINDIFCVIHLRFFTVTVSLGSSYLDQDIQGGTKRKRKKCSDQCKAGELNFSS